MLALASVWIGLLTLLLAVGIVVHRPWMTDLTVLLVLYFGSPGAMCLAGLVLWAHRKEGNEDAGLQGQRRQAKIAIGMSLVAAAIVYLLIIFSTKIDRVERTAVPGGKSSLVHEEDPRSNARYPGQVISCHGDYRDRRVH